jgi:hypothetical protein
MLQLECATHIPEGILIGDKIDNMLSESSREQKRPDASISISPSSKVRETVSLRWFWIGLVLAVPTSLFFGYDRHAILLIRKYSILYVLSWVLVVTIIRKRKGIKLGDPVFRSPNPMPVRVILNSVLALTGYVIGIATVAIFTHQL